MKLSLQEVKDLIVWAKSERVKALEVAGIKVEFSDLAFIDQIEGLDIGQGANPKVGASSDTFENDLKENPDEDEELLFHSVLP